MFPEWIEVFSTGEWTDSQGNTKDWTLDDLNEIVSQYDVKNPAPIVVGHPETDSPAYGWIEALKIEGEKLLAKPGQLIEEFVDWVKRGLYKKISVAIYPDLTLKHIGFLGGAAPAVKGLKPVSFDANKTAWIFEKETSLKFEECGHMNPDDTFIGGFDGCVEHMMQCEGHDEDSARKICAYIGRKAGKIHSEQKGGNIMYEWLTKMKEAIGLAEKQMTPDPSVKFTEADITAKVKETEEKIRKETEATFAEAQKKIDAEKKEKEEAQKKLKEIEDQKRKDDVASFCENLCKEGKLTPALRKIIEPVMIAVSGIPGVIEFSEGVKKSRLDGIKDFLTELPKVVTFREVTPKTGPGAGGDFESLVARTMEEKKISRGKAIQFCAREYPEKHDEYVSNLPAAKKD